MKPSATIEFADLRYDPSDGTLTSADADVSASLRPQVARLLETFLDHPGEVVDRDTLCREVWGEDRVIDFEAGLSALVKELRQALRAAGAAETLLETVPRRGYRFHAAVGPVAAVDTKRGPTGSARFRIGLGALVLVVLLSALGLWRGFGPAPATDDDRPRLAVVPFEMLGEPGPLDPGNLDLVLADSLLAALWQAEIEGLVLLGRTSMGAGLDGPERVAFVARELDASLVLEGSLIPETVNGGAGWRIEARLLRLPRGEVAWTATVSGAPEEPVSAADVAARLAADLVDHWNDIELER